MALNLDKSKEWSEIVKNYVQVLAVIIAGVWAYNLFLKKEAPGLESVVNLNTVLNKYPTINKDANNFTFYVEFKNNGISAVDISKVKIAVWKFKLDLKNVSKPTYINIEEIEKSGTSIFEKEYPNKDSRKNVDILYPFVQHYSPGSSYSHNYQWIIPKGEDDESVCFKIQVYKNFNDKKPTWQSYSWSTLN
ncbi:hypothetical protein V9K67_05890 [Paraflavisolibacter sp. H34]|uniref:hypothetical protein n=1 Tax=Huijunlia imazamoxiresistens TaxID=3127457 RepID=UPI003018F071